MMKKAAIFAAIMTLASFASATQTGYDDLTAEQQLKFELACKGASVTILGAAQSTDAMKELARNILGKPNPPYALMWELTMLIDNSGLSNGSVAYSDIGIAAATEAELEDIIIMPPVNPATDSPFNILADALYGN